MPDLNLLEESLDRLADAAEEAAQQVYNLRGSPGEDAAPAMSGVVGIVSSDPNVIEAVLRIATVVGQTVTIDYLDLAGQRTEGRRITPQEFESTVSLPMVVATDEYRDGGTRRFRIDRIQQVAT